MSKEGRIAVNQHNHDQIRKFGSDMQALQNKFLRKKKRKTNFPAKLGENNPERSSLLPFSFFISSPQNNL